MIRRNWILAAGLIIVVIAALVGGYFIARMSAPAVLIKEIRWISSESDPGTMEAIRAIIGDYEALHPDIRINVEFVSAGDKLKITSAAIAAGNPPEISEPQAATGADWASKGYLLEIDSIINALGKDDMYPAFLITQNDHYYYVPFHASIWGLWLRADLLTAKGLALPNTWADLLADAKALTEDLNGDGIIDRYGICFALSTKDTAAEMLLWEVLWSYAGVDPYDKDLKVVLNSTENKPKVVDALNYLKELFKYAPPGISTYGYGELLSTFTSDKVAISSYGGRMAAIVNRDNPKLNPPVTTWVRYPQGATHAFTVGGGFYCIFNKSRYASEAKDFITWMETSQMTRLWASLPLHYLPFLKSVARSETYQKSNNLLKTYSTELGRLLTCLEGTEGLQQAVSSGAIVGSTIKPVTVNPTAGIAFDSMVMTQMTQKFIIGGLSAEAAVDWAAGALPVA